MHEHTSRQLHSFFIWKFLKHNQANVTVFIAVFEWTISIDFELKVIIFEESDKQIMQNKTDKTKENI